MNVVDSSGWLEYFADGPNADFFAPAIEATSELVVPAISVYEVFKRILQQRSEGEALQAVAVMLRGRVVDLDVQLALTAARPPFFTESRWLTASSWRRPEFTTQHSGRKMSTSIIFPVCSTSPNRRQTNRPDPRFQPTTCCARSRVAFRQLGGG